MKGTTPGPGTADGARRAAKKAGAGPKHSGGSDGHAAAPPAPAPPDESFAGIEIEPIEAPMWPIHPALWFQPELAPSAPQWSGLEIERHNRVPVPDFVRSDIAPFDRPGVRDTSCGALTPCVRPAVPPSDLAPLGWDPRAVCRKEGGK